VREIYRKLASALHPDRETDEREREAKTALMQRVNQACEAQDLLALLQLQLQIEQIDERHIANAGEQRLKH
jgi:curved DNA-binding protein CbpA